ncbi:PAS domain S-box protein [Desulfobacula sp.]|uniref:GAF domain-containing sensor histidine kinase n=1 Tax=Desulfobacula sp. TaxID=2593537 RepID=UPI0026290BE7|nr:PAS domain S-box protein [Desulfobacula sp.]
MVQKPTYEELESRIKTLEKEALEIKEADRETRIASRNHKRFLRFLPYPVLVRDAKERITYLNPAFTDTFGWTLEELKGQEGRQYVPEVLRDELKSKIETLPDKKSVLQFNTKRLTKTGKLLDVIIRIGIDKDADNHLEGLITVLKDVTMERRNKRNRDVMNRISHVLPQYPDLRKLLFYVNTEIKGLLGAESANTILLDKTQTEFYFISAVHDDPATQERIEKTRFPVDDLLSGQVVKTGRPLMINDFPGEHNQYESRDLKIGYKVKNLILVPLRTKDRIIGILAADNKKAGDFDYTDLETLTTIAATVVLSIENARVSRELRKAYEELKSLNHAKDKMISHLSHELKTPVAILLSSFKILSKKMADLPEATWQPTLDRVQRNLERIVGIEGEVSDIVERKEFYHKNIFSLILSQCRDEFESLIAEETGEKGVIAKISQKIENLFVTQDLDIQNIFLNHFVEKRIKTIKPEINRRNISLISRLESSSPIQMPVEPLKKTVDGLIRNAIENTPDGGKIEVLVHPEGNGMHFVVKDHGIGLTREAQKRIFEGFFSTQETLNYSSKRPFDFNAGGKGADLLRMKIFSEKYHFKISMTSQRCRRIPEDKDACPGSIQACSELPGPPCDGMTIVTCFFPFPENS